MSIYTFPKTEHLCLKKEIDALFSGESVALVAFPLRVLFQSVSLCETSPRVKVLISVSKKKFRQAVDRNRAKRQIREAYRLQKHLLLSALPEGTALHVAFIWISDKAVPSSLVHSRMRSLLLRMNEKLCAREGAKE